MPHYVVRYPDGTPAAKGDRVSFGEDEARIEDVVTPENPTDYELPWPGVMMSWEYGLVFIPEKDFVREKIGLRSREA